MLRRAFFAALVLAFSGPVLAAENPAAAPSVGVATMLPNGTILVGVRGPDADGQLQAVLMVEPGDSTYQPIIEHIGGLKPGETKSIPPWDTPPKQDDKPAAPPGED
jgi:hypothetical protein